MGLIWAPQPGPQHALIDCPIPEILFGGARGGGKSDGVLGKHAIKAERYGAGFNGVFFRKEMPQSDDLIERSREIFGPLGGRFDVQKSQWRMPSGARLRFRPLENIAAAEKYQGQNLSDVAVEEAGNFDTPAAIDRLWGALRSKTGVPVQMILTANPGGPGQPWIHQRYIEPAPLGMKVLRATLPNGQEHKRVYIPSKVQDNRVLLANDPDYINRLYLVGSAALVKAWLEGDWSAVEGAFFDQWSGRNIVPPFEIPDGWTRFRSFDWGSARPFSVGWWAVCGETRRVGDITIPRGALIRYAEWYGSTGKPNEGLKLDAEQVAKGIADREKNGPKVLYGVADPAIFARDGGPSIAEMMARAGVHWRPADNARVGRNGAMGGWDQMRARIRGNDEGPMLVVFPTCRDFIRTVPVMQHDPSRPEDLDTKAEDHVADEVRYACMSRPMPAIQAVKPNNPVDLWGRSNKQADGWRVA